ncbi:MAG: beta-N-acetylhexosaminidase, partial [Planctomycetota bacterium]
MRIRLKFIGAVAAVVVWAGAGFAQDAAALRLVPFPKQVRMQKDVFVLDRGLVLEAPAEAGELLAKTIGAELKRAGLPVPETRSIEKGAIFLRLSTRGEGERPAFKFRDGATPEDYSLEVRQDAVVCAAPGEAGLFYAVQTLCQLVRANRRDGGLPCLEVRDWPSLRWRCFQDDMTRGPSSKPELLRSEVALGAHLKMNLFTYYMEHQYAFKKHPLIGPENGSLTPETLSQLVTYAKRFHVDILGNQQSFGHFHHILKHEKYAHLRETPSLLCPVKEESYQLLDDLYSEVC